MKKNKMHSSTKPIITQMSPVFLVSDLVRSIAFYTEILGFSVEFVYEDFYAGIIRDKFSLHLKRNDSLFHTRDEPSEEQHIDLMFTVANIDAVYKFISEAQVLIVQPLRLMPYGREFYISDLDKHIISLFENPDLPIRN